MEILNYLSNNIANVLKDENIINKMEEIEEIRLRVNQNIILKL